MHPQKIQINLLKNHFDLQNFQSRAVPVKIFIELLLEWWARDGQFFQHLALVQELKKLGWTVYRPDNFHPFDADEFRKEGVRRQSVRVADQFVVVNCLDPIDQMKSIAILGDVRKFKSLDLS